MSPGYHYLLGPVIGLLAVGLLALLSRWAFGSPRSRPRVGANRAPVNYGLLVPVATVSSRSDAEQLRALLVRAGIRATVAAAEGTDEGGNRFHVLVFADVEAGARRALARLG